MLPSIEPELHFRPEVKPSVDESGLHGAQLSLEGRVQLETHPDDGWKTNVSGTLNLPEAAGCHGVNGFDDGCHRFSAANAYPRAA